MIIDTHAAPERLLVHTILAEQANEYLMPVKQYRYLALNESGVIVELDGKYQWHIAKKNVARFQAMMNLLQAKKC